MKTTSVKLNPVAITKEQINIIKKNMFTSECDKFFRSTSSRSLNSNIYLFGHLVKDYAKDGINETQANKILGGIKKLLTGKTEPQNVNLVNVIFSTLIKLITPDNLISGALKPDTYRKIIDNSIKIYKTHPLNEVIDYRHILGRMVSLKDMSMEIRKRMNGIPHEMQALEWTPDEQLEMVGTLERIYLQYKKANSGFVYKRSKGQPDNKRSVNENTIKHNYYNSIIKLLWMLRDSSAVMLRNPEGNIEDIKYNIDLASYYASKIPYSDIFRSAKVWKILADFRKFNKQVNSLEKK